MGHQGEHVAVARIHDHDGAGPRAERVLGRLLDPAVDGRVHVGPRHRLLAVEDPDQPPVGVHLDLLAPIPASKVLVVESLEPRLSHEVPAAKTAPPEVLVRGLADIAQEVGREPDSGVRALGLDLDGDPRQVEPPLLDAGDLLERETPREPERPRRIRRDARQPVPELAGGGLDEPRQSVDQGADVRDVARHHDQGEGRSVVDQREPGAVEQDAPGRRDGPEPEPVLVRERGQPLPAQDLEVGELGGDGEEPHAEHRRQEPEPGPLDGGRRARPHHRRETSRPTGQASAAAARIPLYPACGTITRVNSSPSGAG